MHIFSGLPLFFRYSRRIEEPTWLGGSYPFLPTTLTAIPLLLYQPKGNSIFYPLFDSLQYFESFLCFHEKNKENDTFRLKISHIGVFVIVFQNKKFVLFGTSFNFWWHKTTALYKNTWKGRPLFFYDDRLEWKNPGAAWFCWQAQIFIAWKYGAYCLKKRLYYINLFFILVVAWKNILYIFMGPKIICNQLILVIKIRRFSFLH